MSERTWQLAMSGHGLEHVTADTRHDMERLLDLMPGITHLTVEVGNDRIHVMRGWPSDRMAEAENLLRRIASADGILAIVVPGANGVASRRITAD
ncbi:hypothetical protein [Sphingomonas sp. 2378]|uniref:hypothetical protein n=1 Tax=Sphingomonas sp. 2378 TaxID=1219748 RepID=UPI00311B3A78